MEKTRPGLVEEVEDAVEVVAGGMHTVVLNKKGEVWTFGYNDEGSLGRLFGEEEECFVPATVSVKTSLDDVLDPQSSGISASPSGADQCRRQSLCCSH